MNLVIGATGALGGEICRRLAEEGRPLRALVRSSADVERLEVLRALGAELVEGDLKDRASLELACRGATRIVSTATAIGPRQEGDTLDRVDLRGQLDLVDAARAEGVERFVLVSISGSVRADSPFLSGKRAVEAALRMGGVPHSILRPTFFMESWLSPAVGFDIRGGRARIYGAGMRPITWISERDVAHFATAALGSSTGKSEILELGGPEALAPLEVVRICEQESGRRFEVEHVPEEALRSHWQTEEDPRGKSFAAFMLTYAAGDVVDAGPALERYPLARPMTRVRDYVREVLARPSREDTPLAG